MNNKACISISGPSINECLEQIGNYKLIELRYDLFNFDFDQINDLYSKDIQIIATCRPDEKGTDFQKETLKKAIDLGAEFIDVEIERSEEFISEIKNYLKGKDTKLIISYHNFETTPEYSELSDIIVKANALEADFVKVVSTVNDVRDNKKLLALYKDYENIIAFGMGEKAKITRIASVFLGAPFSYVAPGENKLTAPGQLSLDTFIQFTKFLNV